MNTTPDKVKRELDELPHGMPAGPDPQPVKMLGKITAIGFNTLTVDLGGGATTSVLKPTKVVPALDQTNPDFSYQYTGSDGQTRTSTDLSDPTRQEIQVVVPPFFSGDVVEVGPVPINLEAFDASLAGFRLQVVNSPAYWSNQNPQIV